MKTYFYTLSGIVRAVDGVSIEVKEGEWVSIVGESGSGKSTLAYSIVNLVPPPGRIVGGSIVFKGRDLLKLPESEMRSIRGGRIGFVFQDPLTSLDPLRTVGDQLSEVIETHQGLNHKEALEKAARLLEEVGIPASRVKSYPHQLSGGQRQRIAIAMAIALKPDLVIADEPTTALDVIVQDQIMDLFTGIKASGSSIILITHDIALASERSDRIVVMYGGKVVEYGASRDIVERPGHPYTAGLIESVPDLWSDKQVKSIPGNPPDLRDPPKGCRFHPRCPYASEECRVREPPLIDMGNGHYVACLLRR